MTEMKRSGIEVQLLGSADNLRECRGMRESKR